MEPITPFDREEWRASERPEHPFLSRRLNRRLGRTGYTDRHPADGHRFARTATRWSITFIGIVAVVVWALATGGVAAS